MAFQEAPDCAEVTIVYTVSGQQCVNRLNFHKVGGYDQSDIDLLATAVDGTVGAEWLASQSNEALYLHTEVRGLSSIIDLSGFNNTETGLGTQASPVMPGNVTFAVKLNTGRTGRSGRGRLYWIGLYEAACAGNSIVNSTLAQDLADAVAAVQAAAASIQWSMVVLSRVQDNVVLPAAEPLAVTSVSYTDLFLDSQRRRLTGRGT